MAVPEEAKLTTDEQETICDDFQEAQEDKYTCDYYSLAEIVSDKASEKAYKAGMKKAVDNEAETMCTDGKNHLWVDKRCMYCNITRRVEG